MSGGSDVDVHSIPRVHELDSTRLGLPVQPPGRTRGACSLFTLSSTSIESGPGPRTRASPAEGARRPRPSRNGVALWTCTRLATQGAQLAAPHNTHAGGAHASGLVPPVLPAPRPIPHAQLGPS